MARLGTLLMLLGMCAIGYGALWQLGLAPGSRVTLPQPLALERAAAGAREAPASASTPIIQRTGRSAPADDPRLPQAANTAQGSSTSGVDVSTSVTTEPFGSSLTFVPVGPTRTPTPPPAIAVQLASADAAERVDTARPSAAAYAVRLAIPSIKVDTVVQQGGIVQDTHGEPVWQTLPFVAVHYGDLTSKLGVIGNAVIAGHVVTLSEGNVFRFLYQLDIGDEINVWDQLELEHDYRVVDVKLVPPSDTSVMDPTPDETLTLITCGGTFDPIKREFSDRLVVTAKPL